MFSLYCVKNNDSNQMERKENKRKNAVIGNIKLLQNSKKKIPT